MRSWPARRAVIRWAWRLYRREWRQQSLIVALLGVAVAAAVCGAGIAAGAPDPVDPQYGTATYKVTFPGNDPQLAAGIALLRARFAPVDVIEDEVLSGGGAEGVELRAQDPDAPYGNGLISLVSGRYPAGPGQVAVTAQVQSLFDLHVGGTWQAAGRLWRVTGVVADPADLRDAFGLVTPGQVTAPTQVTVLLSAPPGTFANSAPDGSDPHDHFVAPASAASSLIVLSIAIFALVLVGLVATTGFTVMAQRRLRALGMLSSLGATDRDLRLVMTANGVMAGIAGSVCGLAAGLGAWASYAPHLQASTGHVVAVWHLPWLVIAAVTAVALVTPVLAVQLPARAVARLSVVTSLRSRPPTPRSARRSVVLGAILLAAGLTLLALAAPVPAGLGPVAEPGTGVPWLFQGGGIALTCAGMLLLTHAFVALFPMLSGRMPVSVRLALRDLGRYRNRSGPALAAVTLAILICVLLVITVAAISPRPSPLDYTTASNLTSSELVVHAPGSPGSETPQGFGGTTAAASAATAIGGLVRARYVLPLELAIPPVSMPGDVGCWANLYRAGTTDQNQGQVYIATPALLRAFGIDASEVAPGTDILSMRAGLAGVPDLTLGSDPLPAPPPPPPGQHLTGPCDGMPQLSRPAVQTIASLPAGTSAPNTVLTAHAVQRLGLPVFTSGWLIQAAGPLTPAQLNSARQIAQAHSETIEAQVSNPDPGPIIAATATGGGLVLAFMILLLSAALIRGESAGDMRILTAAGASRSSRRTLTGAAAGAVGLLGALLGTAVGYLAAIAWFRHELGTLRPVPLAELATILAGLPVLAALGGWLVAGREPPGIARQPLD